MESPNLAANQAWQQALPRIERQLSKPSYEAFLKAMRPMGLSQDVFVFSVPSLFAKEWLEGRYRRLIVETLEKVLMRGVDVQFVVTAGEPTPVPAPREASPARPVSTEALAATGRYTFDTFVIGSGNRFAHAAALAVAEAPARAYNPLFIYGGVGLGKTHLLQAIGHYVLTHKQIVRVMYVSSEKFTNDLINSIRDDKTVEFRNKYRTADVLLIDDIQFLAGKERTQEEFSRDIPTLEDRLRSRFEWGLIADIQPPDYETRIAILRKKAELDAIDLPDDVVQFIAQRISSNIRELEGALSRLRAHAQISGGRVTVELAAEVLREILPQARVRPVTIAAIQRAVAEFFGIRVEDMKAKRRTKGIAFPRQVAMFLSRELTDASLPRIGEEFGGRDHTTVMHACDRVRGAVTQDAHLAAGIKNLVNSFQTERSASGDKP
ncbi:MAG: chromosomal replication initiator protein DnaA [Bacillati bacterium ANGP1]|uniref:Chromosomal replication initiator protein DnaA n=1 Tax=Candidatus Segetimicrobium genomatis TaxID=2569760 RepID=A0A537J255_9BACT|nr:MAG: chromosomal replication initiator protein DnaA [Terrabacteria group bacterium ANGP1]